MSRNRERDSDLLPLSSAQTVGLAAINNSQHCDDRSANKDAEPPLGVKLTVYRLLNIMTILSFVISKDILTIEGQVAAPTRLDWISGGVLGVVLYWIGLQEQRKAKKWEWFFESDLAPTIGYCTIGIMHSIGQAIALVLLIFLNMPSLFLALLVSCLMSSWFFYLLYLSEMHFCLGAKLGIVLGTYISVSLLFLGVNALTRRVQARAWVTQRAMRFADSYEPGALAAAGYGGFDVVGMVVGAWCLIAIYAVPYVLVVYGLALGLP